MSEIRTIYSGFQAKNILFPLGRGRDMRGDLGCNNSGGANFRSFGAMKVCNSDKFSTRAQKRGSTVQPCIWDIVYQYLDSIGQACLEGNISPTDDGFQELKRNYSESVNVIFLYRVIR